MTDASQSSGALQAIVRRPGGEGLADCELSYLDRAPVDGTLLAEQHAAYVRTLRDAGVDVLELDPLEGHPDALYVEDCAVVLDEVALIARPGAESRRGEVASVAEVLATHRELLVLDQPCTLEGGDVMVIDDVLLIGWSKRTNHAGLKRAAHLLFEHGYTVKAAEVDGCLHLKSAITNLGDGRVLANPSWANLERLRGVETIEVAPEEPFGANVLRVGDVVIASDAYPRTNDRLRALGYDVRALELSEVHKMEAAVTCPSIVFSAMG